jgi:phosphonoacetate hydrolase
MARDGNVELNGVTYRWPNRPSVVVCIDGGDPAYIESGLRDGVIPNIKRFMEEGFHKVAQGTVPSFTCPNNMSIATGAEPNVHGISGNYYYDATTKKEVVMTGPELLRSETIFAEFAKAGAKVIAITSKDKLRQQLGKNMPLGNGNMCFSAQYADRCTLEENGVENVLELVGQPLPDMYSAELSLFVLDAGIKLLEEQKPDILYLSLTDFIQHKYAPGEDAANRFYRDIDDRIGRLADLGAAIGLIADHGMSDKSQDDGSPNVIWLQDLLDEEFGPGTTKVVCPITDPFVAHHGALGGFVRVWCVGGADPAGVLNYVKTVTGIAMALTKDEACDEFDLPADREGDVVVISEQGTCIGSTEAAHDLEGLKGHRLRTHGGVTERQVPFIISQPLNDAYEAKAASGTLRSHQIYDFLINGAA